MKKKSKLLISAASLSLLTVLSVPTILTSCSNNKTSVIEYSMTFQTSSTYSLGDNNVLPSDVDNEWIKNKVIENKDSIFSINNEPADFDWNSNLSISEVNPSNSNGELSFKCSLNKSDQNSQTIDKTITFTGFKTQQVNNNYSIVFNNNSSSYRLGDSTILPSSIDGEWIKNKIIDNKNSIFSISNEPANFDWSNNLSISNINADDSNGELSFNCSLYKSNQNGQTIDKTITFTGFKTQPVNNYYSITFKDTTSSYAFGDNTILPSNVNSEWIKEKVIQNKDSIFSISNAPADFDWNSNLSISILSTDNTNGQLSFNVTLNRATDNPATTSTISKQLTFTGFLTNTSTSDNGILSPVSPDSIPSDIPQKAPETEEEKKWGNVLLPKIDDSQITMDHLVKMLDDHMGNTNNVKVTFGERKISSKLMADAFAKWTTTRWKYFPYFGFSNPVFQINIKDELGKPIIWKYMQEWNKPEYIEKTYYVDYLSTTTGEVFDYYAEKWLIPGYSKNTFIEFVNDFLNLISYDMDGIDKVITAYFYVANYLKYLDSPSIEATIKEHIGVCADYASLTALLCNIVGVPALPMITSHDIKTAMHEIVWVYINDLYDGTTKKWYALDPTFAYTRGGYYGKPISFWPSNLKVENVIFNFNSNPYVPYPTEDHYNSNLFFNAPWQTLYDNNMLETRPIPDNIVSENYKNKSNPVYYNGYWYYYCYDNKSSTQPKNNNKLVRQKFITGNTYEVVIDFSNPQNPDPNHFGFNISEEICNLFKWFSTSSFKYNAFGYNEKIVICTNVKPDVSNNSVKFLIIDLNTKQCKLINQTADIKTPSSLKDFNFYIKDGEIYYTNDPYGPGQTSFFNKTYAKLTLTPDEYNFLNSSSDSRSKLFRKLVSYRTTAGTYLIGDDPVNNVSEESKRNFMQYLYDLEQQLNNNQITDFDAKMKELDSKFNAFIPPITSQGIIKTNELCDVYQYEKSYVDLIDSLPMNKLILMDNLSDFNANDNNTEFDIYYSKTKDGTYTKVRDGLSVEGTGINVRLSDIGQTSYDGYYYFEYYPYGLYDQRQKSKIFEIQVVERKTLPDYEGLYSQSLRNTNYYVDSPNWYNNQIALSFKLNGMSNVQNPIDLKLKYINFDTKEISTLDTKTINGGTSSTVVEKWALDRPSQKNHGIYWVEYTTSANNNSYKFFSSFYFHFTKNDVDNFDVSEWASLSNLIN